MVFINITGTIGIIIQSSIDMTGSLFASILLIIGLILATAMLFRIPLELTAPLILPMLLVCMAYSSEYLTIGGFILMYLGLLFAKKFFA